MSKRMRGHFKPKPRDFFATPPEAVSALMRALPPATRFLEPCAGDGALVRILEGAGHRCVWAYDIEPQDAGIDRLDARAVGEHLGMSVVTNPPFSQAGALLAHWLRSGVGDVWLLHPHDWLCNLNWQGFTPHLNVVAPIARVRWIEGSPHQSTENFIWARYMPNPSGWLRWSPRVK